MVPITHLDAPPQLQSTLTAAQEMQLLNLFQRNFPLVSRPFAVLAAQLKISETDVIDALRDLRARGLISRVGAVFRPNAVGVSVLAALSVPAERLEQVARFVSGFAQVNHNYEREHLYNLWFVVTAIDAAALHAVLQEIEHACECGAVLVLPMLKDHHIDLGFNLSTSRNGRFHQIHAAGDQPALIHDRNAPATPVPVSTKERALIAALQDGLPLVERPFAELGCSEAHAIATLARWIDDGVIKRFGVIVRHHELGYTDNAMVVWDIPDEQVDAAGQRIAASGLITLCYQRPRVLPNWPYNLFCMLHGKDRREVQARIVELAEICMLGDYPRAILFSRRRFKQRGAHYGATPVNNRDPEAQHG